MTALLDSDLADAYRNASPFPHVVLDNFYPEDRLKAVIAEISAAKIDPEAPGYGWFGKRRASNLESFPRETRKLVEEMNAAPFISWLESITGIEGLMPDPYFEGAGIHQIPRGGYLKIHTDFNWHQRLQLHRRVNVLLYLNEDWQEEWGGQLEFWDEKQIASANGKAGARLSPILNRLVIFSTTDFSYHGHPEKLQCPEDRTRNSIALYYYTKERPDSETQFGNATITNYRERSGEHMGLKHKIHQALLKNKWLRRLLRRY